MILYYSVFSLLIIFVFFLIQRKKTSQNIARYDLDCGEYIELIGIQKYSKVPRTFIIEGYIPESWTKCNPLISTKPQKKISFEFLDINSVMFWSTDAPMNSIKNTTKKHFKWKISFNEITWEHVKNSQGRVVMKFGNSPVAPSKIQKYYEFFLPLIIKGFDSVSPELDEKHKNDDKYCQLCDSYNFNRDVSIKNNTNRNEGVFITDKKFLSDLEFAILEPEYDELNKLYEKYKDAIDWSGGPRCKGLVGRVNGFKFIVHSNDHDTHFHVIHDEKGIDARFSFPGINLLDYKNKRQMINSKQIKAIQKYFATPENLKRLRKEINRRNA